MLQELWTSMVVLARHADAAACIFLASLIALQPDATADHATSWLALLRDLPLKVSLHSRQSMQMFLVKDQRMPLTRLGSGGQLQPVLHVALLVVAAQQPLAGRRHHLVRQVLQQVVQQAGVACAERLTALEVIGT